MPCKIYHYVHWVNIGLNTADCAAVEAEEELKESEEGNTPDVPPQPTPTYEKSDSLGVLQHQYLSDKCTGCCPWHDMHYVNMVYVRVPYVSVAQTIVKCIRRTGNTIDDHWII
eukprot:1138948_1